MKKLVIGCCMFLCCFCRIGNTTVPLEEFSKGQGKFSVGISLNEKIKSGKVSTTNNGKFSCNVVVAFNRRLALEYGHKESNLIRGYTYNNITYLTDGDLQQDDILLIYNATPLTDKTPGINLYGGLKHLRGTLSGTVAGYNVNRMLAYTGGVVGINGVYNIPKFAKLWGDVYYAQKIIGGEFGLSKQIAKNCDIDVSYFMDRYKTSGFTLTDKGLRIGLSHRFKMNTTRKTKK